MPAVNESRVKARLTPNRPKQLVENDEYADFVRRVLTALRRRIAAGDIESVADLVGLADQITTEIQLAVASLRGCGYSWADIATRVGVTRQAAQQRWGSSEPLGPLGVSA